MKSIGQTTDTTALLLNSLEAERPCRDMSALTMSYEGYAFVDLRVDLGATSSAQTEPGLITIIILLFPSCYHHDLTIPYIRLTAIIKITLLVSRFDSTPSRDTRLGLQIDPVKPRIPQVGQDPQAIAIIYIISSILTA
jgi:hypothetical protein